MNKKLKGLTVVEILMASALFTIVVLGISQTILAMHRYSRATLFKIQAHFLATSYFEQVLCNFHPYELSMLPSNVDSFSISLRTLKNPATSTALYYNRTNWTNTDTAVVGASVDPGITPTQSTTMTTKKNIFHATVYEANDLTVYIELTISNSPLYDNYQNLSRTEINPPEGFQSLRMKYIWNGPTATDLSDQTTWPSNELYAIRQLQPDDYEQKVAY